MIRHYRKIFKLLSQNMEIMRDKIMKALENVIDPETGLSVVEMGMIRDIKISENNVEILFAPTTPLCPMLSYLINEIKQAAKSIEGVKEVEVKVIA